MLIKLLRSVFSSPKESGERSGDPDQATLNSLIMLFGTGSYAELEVKAQQLLVAYPNSGGVWKILGAVLETLAKDPLPAMFKAIALLPTDIEARTNLAYALRKRNRLNEAAKIYQEAKALSPRNTDILESLGLVYLGLSDLSAAESCFREVIAIDNRKFSSYVNLGIVLRRCGEVEDAIKQFQIALEFNPTHPVACNAYAAALMDRGLFDAAEKFFRIALDSDSGYIDAKNNLAYLLSQTGQVAESISLLENIIDTENWRPDAYNNLLYILSSAQTAVLPEQILAFAKRYGAHVSAQARPYKTWHCSSAENKRLKIGLVSADLRNHPVGYFIEGIVQSLSSRFKDKLELHVYSNSVIYDELSARINSACVAWTSIAGQNDSDVAKIIHEQGIDILVDLSGHTDGNRLPLFGWKAAPVQVTWLGYWGTTGVSEIDYIIADRHTLPESDAWQFSEQVWYLPETRLCFTYPQHAFPVEQLPAINNGYITFGCFNRLEKISEEVLVTWCRILKKIPCSRLLVKAKQLNEPIRQDWLLQRFAREGIAKERIILEGHSERNEYLATYHRVDIALDPFPFTGGTTTVEALWMGVPVMTMAGHSLLSRQGVGLMTNADLGEWIAATPDEYVACVVKQASDQVALAKLRLSLRDQVYASPIFNTARFAEHLASAFEKMWQKWCAKANSNQS